MRRRNNIIDNIKRIWVDFKDWWEYAVDYEKAMAKEEEKENKIDGLKIIIENKDQKIKELNEIIKAKDEVISNLEDRIIELKQKISELMKDNGEEL